MLYYIETDPNAKISDLEALEAALNSLDAVSAYGELDGVEICDVEDEPDTAFKVGDTVRLAKDVPADVVTHWNIQSLIERPLEIVGLEGKDWLDANIRVKSEGSCVTWVVPVEYLVKCSS